jgi:hypothetical protein
VGNSGSLWIIGGVVLAALTGAGCQRSLADSADYSPSNVSALRAALGGDKAAAAGPAAAAATPTGWATVQGVFKINGAPPPRATLNIDKEQDVCMPGGGPVLAEDVVIGDAGGIKDVVIYLETRYPTDDPAWEHSDYAATKSGEVIFDQKNCIFLSHVFAMRTTQTLKVLNSDPPQVGHNTKIDGGGGARSDNFTVPGGSSQVYSPGGESPEPFGVACSIHTWMKAYGLVRNSPYLAVTDKDGRFELKNLPAGVSLRFRVWQERARFIQSVTATGKIDKYNKGRLELKLEPDESRQLELVVDAKLLGGT